MSHTTISCVVLTSVFKQNLSQDSSLLIIPADYAKIKFT